MKITFLHQFGGGNRPSPRALVPVTIVMFFVSFSTYLAIPDTAYAQSPTLSEEEKRELERLIGKEEKRDEGVTKPSEKGAGPSRRFEDKSPRSDDSKFEDLSKKDAQREDKFDPRDAEKIHIDDGSKGIRVEKLSVVQIHHADIRVKGGFDKQLEKLKGKVPEGEIAARLEVLYKPSPEARNDPNIADWERKRWRELVRDYKSAQLQAALLTDLGQLKITQSRRAAQTAKPDGKVDGGSGRNPPSRAGIGAGRNSPGSNSTGAGQDRQPGSTRGLSGQAANDQAGSGNSGTPQKGAAGGGPGAAPGGQGVRASGTPQTGSSHAGASQLGMRQPGSPHQGALNPGIPSSGGSGTGTAQLGHGQGSRPGTGSGTGSGTGTRTSSQNTPPSSSKFGQFMQQLLGGGGAAPGNARPTGQRTASNNSRGQNLSDRLSATAGTGGIQSRAGQNGTGAESSGTGSQRMQATRSASSARPVPGNIAQPGAQIASVPGGQTGGNATRNSRGMSLQGIGKGPSSASQKGSTRASSGSSGAVVGPQSIRQGRKAGVMVPPPPQHLRGAASGSKSPGGTANQINTAGSQKGPGYSSSQSSGQTHDQVSSKPSLRPPAQTPQGTSGRFQGGSTGASSVPPGGTPSSPSGQSRVASVSTQGARARGAPRVAPWPPGRKPTRPGFQKMAASANSSEASTSIGRAQPGRIIRSSNQSGAASNSPSVSGRLTLRGSHPAKPNIHSGGHVSASGKTSSATLSSASSGAQNTFSSGSQPSSSAAAGAGASGITGSGTASGTEVGQQFPGTSSQITSGSQTSAPSYSSRFGFDQEIAALGQGGASSSALGPSSSSRQGSSASAPNPRGNTKNSASNGIGDVPSAGSSGGQVTSDNSGTASTTVGSSRISRLNTSGSLGLSAKKNSSSAPAPVEEPQTGSPSQTTGETSPLNSGEQRASLSPSGHLGAFPENSSGGGSGAGPSSATPTGVQESLEERRQRKFEEDSATVTAMDKFKRQNFEKDYSVTLSPVEEKLVEEEMNKFVRMSREEREAAKAKTEKTEQIIEDLNMDALLDEAEKDLNNGEIAVYGNDALAAARVGGEAANLYMEVTGGVAGKAAAGGLEDFEDVLSAPAHKKGNDVSDRASELLPEPYEQALKTTTSSTDAAQNTAETAKSADDPNKVTSLESTETALGWIRNKVDLVKNSPAGKKISLWLSGAKRVTKSVLIVEEVRREHVTNMDNIEVNRGRIEKVREQAKLSQTRLRKRLERQRRTEELYSLCKHDPACSTGEPEQRVVLP